MWNIHHAMQGLKRLLSNRDYLQSGMLILLLIAIFAVKDIQNPAVGHPCNLIGQQSNQKSCLAAFVDALPLNLRLRKGGIPYPRLKMDINSSDLCSRVTRYGDRYQTESLIWVMHLQLPNTHLGFVPMRLLCFKHPYLANESKFPFCKKKLHLSTTHDHEIGRSLLGSVHFVNLTKLLGC